MRRSQIEKDGDNDAHGMHHQSQEAGAFAAEGEGTRDQALLDSTINTLDSILTSVMTVEETISYRQACQAFASIHTNREMRCKFLQAESFQPGLAAHRMAQYFDYTGALFGRGELGKMITVSTVSMFNRNVLLRVLFYMLDVVARDNHTQQNGIVLVRYHLDNEVMTVCDPILEMQIEIFIRLAAPVKVAAVHIVSNNPTILQAIRATVTKALSNDMQNQLFAHTGEETLLAHGLSRSMLPVTPAGKQRTERHLDWIRTRASMEQQMPRFQNPSQQHQAALLQPTPTIPTNTDNNLPQQQQQQEQQLPPQGPFNQAASTGLNTTGDGGVAAGSSTAERKESAKGSKNEIITTPSSESDRPRSLPATISLNSDPHVLSSYQCKLREHIEAFEATDEDVKYNDSRMNRHVLPGQVGMRCKHCGNLAQWRRAASAAYYPTRLDAVYQVGQNLAKNHILEGCLAVPASEREELVNLRAERARASGGKEYWRQASIYIGLFEDQEAEGIRFKSLRLL